MYTSSTYFWKGNDNGSNTAQIAKDVDGRYIPFLGRGVLVYQT
jgi:hypothetical protein